MTGQMSIMDWMPEALPDHAETSQTEEVIDWAEILHRECPGIVRSYIRGGGDRDGWFASKFGICGGSIPITEDGWGCIMYNTKGVKIRFREEEHNWTWKEYARLVASKFYTRRWK